MKKVLLITYYYPPYTGIEGNRVKSWFQDFKKYGWEPVVLTRHWSNEQPKNWEDYQKESTMPFSEEILPEGRVFRIPYIKPPLYKKLVKRKIIGPLYYWGLKFVGHLHPETNANYCLRQAADDILSKEKFDALIVTSPPLNINRLGHELSVKHKLPVIFDFRDSYNNRLLNSNYHPDILGKLENRLFRNYVRKWIKSAHFITGVSQPVLDIIQTKKTIKEAIILNGFEEDVFRNIAYSSADNTRLSIAVIGNLYPEQEIDFMIRGFQILFEHLKEAKIIIQFIGLNNELVADMIRRDLPGDKIFITKRISREEALKFMTDAQVLYYPAWRGAKGIYSGKIFEYLGANRRVLIAPGDHDVIDDLINKTGAGFAAYEPEAMAECLIKWYNEWLIKGVLLGTTDESSILEFTREHQTKKIIHILNEIGNEHIHKVGN